MKTHTDYLTFNTKQRQEIIDITDAVEACRAAADIDEGMVLVSAMHISASVFVNDHEPGSLEGHSRLARGDDRALGSGALSPQQRNRRGQRRRASAIADDRPRGDRPGHRRALDLGPWQRIFYGEWDGQRPKRVILKAMGDVTAEQTASSKSYGRSRRRPH